MTQAPEEVLPSLPADLLPGPDTVRQFNADEPLQQIVKRLVGNADIVMQVDCASSRVNFEVIGWFVIPDRAVWRLVATSGA